MNGLELLQALNDLYDEYPNYIDWEKSTRKKLVTRVKDVLFDETKSYTVIPADVAKYYATQAPNLGSGMRQLSSITGDWRAIDGLAKECLEIFKLTCPNVLRKESRALGLEPKF